MQIGELHAAFEVKLSIIDSTLAMEELARGYDLSLRLVLRIFLLQSSFLVNL